MVVGGRQGEAPVPGQGERLGALHAVWLSDCDGVAGSVCEAKLAIAWMNQSSPQGRDACAFPFPPQQPIFICSPPRFLTDDILRVELRPDVVRVAPERGRQRRHLRGQLVAGVQRKVALLYFDKGWCQG